MDNIIKWSADGRQHWKTIGPHKADAERALREILTEIDAGMYSMIPPIGFTDFSTLWLRDYAEVRLKPSTVASYRSTVGHLQDWFGNRQLLDIRPQFIDRFIADRLRHGIAKNTVANEMTLLDQIFGCAIAWNFLRVNPCASVSRLKVEPRVMDFLRPDEVRRFLGVVDPAFSTLFLTAVLTGMRRGELLALMWSDIDWQRHIIRVKRSFDGTQFILPKSSSSIRDILMTPRLADALHQSHKTRHTNSNLIFCTPDGTPINARHIVRTQFEPALQRAGLRRIRFHDLRHTYVAMAIAQGAHPKFIQHQLGHASIQTTLDRYGHLLLRDSEHIGMRLDELLHATAHSSVSLSRTASA